jgi:hypothetical protein
MRCHRHARASALTSVPSGCGLSLGTSSLPSGATMRLHPLRRWKRMGMPMINVVSRILRLALLAPDIVEAILEGRADQALI